MNRRHFPRFNFSPRTIWTGDCKRVLRGLNSDTVDLVYLDPPFATRRSWAGKKGTASAGSVFSDSWVSADGDDIPSLRERQSDLLNLVLAFQMVCDVSLFNYLGYMAARLFEIHRVLASTGSVYVHCDTRSSHYLKLILDCLFGTKRFRNELIWQRGNVGQGAEAISNQWPRSHDVILFYSKGDHWTYNHTYRPLSQVQRDRHTKVDPATGRRFRTSTVGKYTEKILSSIEKRKSHICVLVGKTT